MMTTVYVIATDPDNQLPADMWRDYTAAIRRVLDEHAERVQGVWQSPTSAAWPSQCIAIRIAEPRMPDLRKALASVRAFYGLHSIVWAVADTHLYL